MRLHDVRNVTSTLTDFVATRLGTSPQLTAVVLYLLSTSLLITSLLLLGIVAYFTCCFCHSGARRASCDVLFAGKCISSA